MSIHSGKAGGAFSAAGAASARRRLNRVVRIRSVGRGGENFSCAAGASRGLIPFDARLRVSSVKGSPGLEGVLARGGFGRDFRRKAREESKKSWAPHVLFSLYLSPQSFSRAAPRRRTRPSRSSRGAPRRARSSRHLLPPRAYASSRPARRAAYASKSTRRRASRSEERRVGKECRSRWSPYH